MSSEFVLGVIIAAIGAMGMSVIFVATRKMKNMNFAVI